ncbi:NADH-ubiquinone oxidoreductase [Lactarius tabidus]
MASSIVSPLRNTYRYLQRQAHESPVLFYSVVLGLVGPVLAFGVPPISERMGYRPPEPIPTTYPSALPHVYRPRRPVQGYEDEE